MSTTTLPALLPPPAAVLPPPASISSVTVVLHQQRDSTGERLGLVALGFALGVLAALLVRWLSGLYRKAQQQAAAPAPGVVEAQHHVAIGIQPPRAGEGVAAASAPQARSTPPATTDHRRDRPAAGGPSSSSSLPATNPATDRRRDRP